MTLLDTPSHLETSQSTNRILLTAALAAALTALLHIVGGGIDTARPLIESSLEEEPRLVMFSVWHMASVSMSLSAIALLLGALPRHSHRAHYLTVFIGLMWIGFGLSFVGVALTQQGDNLLFRVLPQWILLLPTGLLALWGGRRHQGMSR